MFAHRTDEVLAAWRRLVEPQGSALLREAERCDPQRPADVAALRRQWSAVETAAALDCVRARRMLAGRIDEADRLMADPLGAEQASGTLPARWKAARFARAVMPVVDVCSGIGGDLMELARVVPTIGIDHDPLRAWMAACNSGVQVVSADAAEVFADAQTLVHIDPARRHEGGPRRHGWRTLVPGPEVIGEWMRRSGGGAIKLGPGTNFADLPDAAETEIEVIAQERRLVQAVLWFGSLAEAGLRRATRLPEGRSFAGRPSPPRRTPAGASEDILLLPDPAVERAGLVGTLLEASPFGEWAPGLGLLRGGRKEDVPEVARPWMTCCEVVDVLPWRLPLIDRRLASIGAKVVDIRTRGGAIDPDEVRKHLGRGGGEAETLLFGLRLGRTRRAIIARRLSCTP